MTDVKQEIERIIDEAENAAEAAERIMKVIEQVAQGYYARGVAAQAKAVRIRLGVEVPSDHN